tara:strand:- start:118 stop:402 length:285 start_codon:yes stop_codon:yes gene_type:complete
MKIVETGLSQAKETEVKLHLATTTNEKGSDTLQAFGGQNARVINGKQLDKTGLAASDKLAQLGHARLLLMKSAESLTARLQANAKEIEAELKAQ